MSKGTKRHYFGTDGIRGMANEFLTPELALKVAQAAGYVFMRNNGEHRHQVIIGKDTRESGYMIEYAMVAGFTSVGMDVFLTGPLPTPAIAKLTRSMRCDMGVMITASHNPYEDNGIKLFGADGYKLPDEIEQEIEKLILADPSQYKAKSGKLGHAKRIDGVEERYIESVKGTLLQGDNFEKIKIVIDCANGAAHKVAPWTLRELGANVVAIGVEPNGTNINDKCGSTHPRKTAAMVIDQEADIGIALDGDADRLIIIDEKGQVVDGDQVLALIASSWQETGLLKGGIVATVMSNLGFERFVRDTLKVPFERTQVGDRYVNEKMRELGYNLGGEQSGHVICSDFSTTGDGLIAALQVVSVLKKKKRPASEVLHLFNPVPQIQREVPDPKKILLKKPLVQAVIQQSIQKLGQSGRLLVRNSGTEPVLRLMVEGDNHLLIEQVMDDLLAVMQ